jgi:hypothetical protein
VFNKLRPGVLGAPIRRIASFATISVQAEKPAPVPGFHQSKTEHIPEKRRIKTRDGSWFLSHVCERRSDD